MTVWIRPRWIVGRVSFDPRHVVHQVEALLSSIGHVGLLVVFASREITIEDDSEELHAAPADRTRGLQSESR